jgi:hypothetical protein
MGKLEWAFYSVGYDRVKKKDGDIMDRTDYVKKLRISEREKERKGKWPWEFHHLTGKLLDNTNSVKECDRW